MCCRFGASRATQDALQALIDAKQLQRGDVACLPVGDYGPGAPACVVYTPARGHLPALRSMTWGFPSKQGLLINARCETAGEKRSFAESMQYRRCLVPCAQFYEWDHTHTLYSFHPPDQSPLLWLGACYAFFDGAPRFTVLTTQANASVQPVHPRMPLLIAPEHVHAWFGDSYLQLLTQPMPDLVRYTPYEQLCFL